MVATGTHDSRAGRRRRRDVEHHRLHRTDTCVSFGDGAGAVVWRVAKEAIPRTSSTSRTKGRCGGRRSACRRAAAGARCTRPWTSVSTTSSRTASGLQVRRAQDKKDCRRLLEQTGTDPKDVDLFVAPGERRIISAAADRLGFDSKKVVINLAALRQHDRRQPSRSRSPTRCAQGALKRGDLVLLASVGGSRSGPSS